MSKASKSLRTVLARQPPPKQSIASTPATGTIRVRDFATHPRANTLSTFTYKMAPLLPVLRDLSIQRPCTQFILDYFRVSINGAEAYLAAPGLVQHRTLQISDILESSGAATGERRFQVRQATQDEVTKAIPFWNGSGRFTWKYLNIDNTTGRRKSENDQMMPEQAVMQGAAFTEIVLDVGKSRSGGRFTAATPDATISIAKSGGGVQIAQVTKIYGRAI